jgi:hypothetical protein
MLSKFARSLLQESEILGVGGEGRIGQFLSLLPAATVQIRAVGVYDGDMREKIGDLVNGWPVTALPFPTSIEAAFRDLVDTKCEAVSRAFAAEIDDIAVAHSSLIGHDIHDWFEDIGRSLGKTYEQSALAFVTAWLEQPDNYDRAESFCLELDKAVRTQFSTTKS